MGEIRIVGSVDASNVTKLKAALEELFQKGVYKVVVNLAETKHIASSGFGCSLISLDTVRENDGQIICASTPTGIRRIFDVLGLSEVLHFSDDVDSALTNSAVNLVSDMGSEGTNTGKCIASGLRRLLIKE